MYHLSPLYKSEPNEGEDDNMFDSLSHVDVIGMNHLTLTVTIINYIYNMFMFN